MVSKQMRRNRVGQFSVQVIEFRQPAAKHNDVRIKNVDDVRETPGEPVCVSQNSVARGDIARVAERCDFANF